MIKSHYWLKPQVGWKIVNMFDITMQSKSVFNTQMKVDVFILDHRYGCECAFGSDTYIYCYIYIACGTQMQVKKLDFYHLE